MLTLEEMAVRTPADPPVLPVTEEAVTVACQGAEGAYSNLAAKKLFPNGTCIYLRNFDAVARAVTGGMCDYGMLPIENNTYGSVKDVYRVLTEHEVRIVRAHRLRIRHELIAKEGVTKKDIRTIISHEQALGQCSRFLHALGDSIRIEAALNTAVAARTVAEGDDPSLAAISSPECAALYGLKTIERHIADSEYNYTRFICISAHEAAVPEANRISLILSLPHRPGSLAEILNAFAEKNVNLLKIESTPVPGKNFEFLFYLDLEASLKDPGIRALLEELYKTCPSCMFLGNYPED